MAENSPGPTHGTAKKPQRRVRKAAEIHLQPPRFVPLDEAHEAAAVRPLASLISDSSARDVVARNRPDDQAPTTDPPAEPDWRARFGDMLDKPPDPAMVARLRKLQDVLDEQEQTTSRVNVPRAGKRSARPSHVFSRQV